MIAITIAAGVVAASESNAFATVTDDSSTCEGDYLSRKLVAPSQAGSHTPPPVAATYPAFGAGAAGYVHCHYEFPVDDIAVTGTPVDLLQDVSLDGYGFDVTYVTYTITVPKGYTPLVQFDAIPLPVQVSTQVAATEVMYGGSTAAYVRVKDRTSAKLIGVPKGLNRGDKLFLDIFGAAYPKPGYIPGSR
jgi:hypothetical protein